MQLRRHRMRKQARRDSALASSIPRETRRHSDGFDDEPIGDPDWIWVGNQRMFVVGHTPGGVPFGCYADELEDLEAYAERG